MKIVFVVPDMPGGGTEKVVSLLANEYAKQGVDTAVFMFAGDKVEYPLDDCIEIVSAGKPSKGNPWIRLKRLAVMRRYFKINRGALIFSFSTIGTGFIVMSTIGMKRTMLVSERTDPNTCDHKLYRNWFYRFGKVLVCQTQAAADSFPEYLRKKTVVIPNPVDGNLPQPFEGKRKKKIVTAGRLVAVKNQKMLLDAFSSFSGKFPDYQLGIYGKGELEEELKEHARELGMEGSVCFHGFCQDVYREIHDSAMFVLSSNYEGVSNSMAEAMAMGIPVIATDCPPGGCRAYIKDGVNGLLVPAGDKDALAAAMERLVKEEGLADSISFHAAKLRRRYPVEKVASAMISAVANDAKHKG